MDIVENVVTDVVENVVEEAVEKTVENAIAPVSKEVTSVVVETGYKNGLITGVAITVGAICVKKFVVPVVARKISEAMQKRKNGEKSSETVIDENPASN